MKVNLTEHRRVYVDTGPYKTLTEADLQLLVDGVVDTVGLSVTSETMAIVCDLGARYRLDSLVYYRDPATTENITIYGKQGDSGFDWEEVGVTVAADRVVVDFTSVLGHFEQIKILHTVTSTTSTVYELEVWADEEHVLFGPAGQSTVFSVDSGTDTLLPEPIQVYNPESATADFYCLIDPDTPNPMGASLGSAFSGPFYSLYETGASLPTNFPWSAGSLQNVVESSDKLTLVTGTYGIYYTPVIDVDTVTGRRLFWDATVTGTTSVDDPSRADSVPTVGVRFSDTVPTDGGWSSGQLSVDTNWSVVSGTLPFETYDNNHILNPKYKRYFQAKVEFVSTVDGDTPLLGGIGIEQAIKVTVPPQTYQEVFIKSNYSEHIPGRTAGIVVWSPEARNLGQ